MLFIVIFQRAESRWLHRAGFRPGGSLESQDLIVLVADWLNGLQTSNDRANGIKVPNRWSVFSPFCRGYLRF